MGQQGMAGGQAERSRSRRDGDEGSGERPQRISAGLLSALRLDAVGWALMSVASIISTSGSGASGGSAASGDSAESDADNSEKIRSKTPLSHQRR